MNGKKTYQVVDEGIARTFQNIRLFKKMTVLENVKVAMNKDMQYSPLASVFRTRSYWKEEQDTDEKAMELLELVGLSGKADYIAMNLPYGQQRKLEIARALGTNMKLLLLDAPAAGMNPVETDELLDIINRIRTQFGISVLLIEHDMSLVMRVCERIQVIDYGVTIAEGTPEEIAHNPRVIEAYLGKQAEKDVLSMKDASGHVIGGAGRQTEETEDEAETSQG